MECVDKFCVYEPTFGANAGPYSCRLMDVNDPTMVGKSSVDNRCLPENVAQASECAFGFYCLDTTDSNKCV